MHFGMITTVLLFIMYSGFFTDGIIPSLVLKLLLLKGTLLLGPPIALGAFVVGQGSGLIIGRLIGNSRILERIRNVRPHLDTFFNYYGDVGHDGHVEHFGHDGHVGHFGHVGHYGHVGLTEHFGWDRPFHYHKNIYPTHQHFDDLPQNYFNSYNQSPYGTHTYDTTHAPYYGTSNSYYPTPEYTTPYHTNSNSALFNTNYPSIDSNHPALNYGEKYKKFNTETRPTYKTQSMDNNDGDYQLSLTEQGSLEGSDVKHIRGNNHGTKYKSVSPEYKGNNNGYQYSYTETEIMPTYEVGYKSFEVNDNEAFGSTQYEQSQKKPSRQKAPTTMRVPDTKTKASAVAENYIIEQFLKPTNGEPELSEEKKLDALADILRSQFHNEFLNSIEKETQKTEETTDVTTTQPSPTPLATKLKKFESNIPKLKKVVPRDKKSVGMMSPLLDALSNVEAPDLVPSSLMSWLMDGYEPFSSDWILRNRKKRQISKSDSVKDLDLDKVTISFIQDVKNLFSIISFLDINRCLEKMVCEIHSQQHHGATEYENNIVTAFKIMDRVMPLDASVEDSTTKYRLAAHLGQKTSTGQSCVEVFSGCGFSTQQIIHLGNIAVPQNLKNVPESRSNTNPEEADENTGT